MMKPVIFNSEMVMATLDGRKTQFREVIKPQPDVAYGGVCKIYLEQHPFQGGFISEAVGRFVETGIKDGTMAWVAYDWCENAVGIEDENWIKLKYYPGDILYVRETFCEVPYEYEHIPINGGHITLPRFAYKADSEVDCTGIWKSPVCMPREAARIFLKVKNVRVERLQEITEEDAKAEGMMMIGMETYRDEFVEFWDHFNRKYSWESNPFIWVIEFEIIKRRW